MFELLHLPGDALHLWSAQIDLRWVAVLGGLCLIVGDISWRRGQPHRATAASSDGSSQSGTGSSSADDSTNALLSALQALSGNSSSSPEDTLNALLKSLQSGSTASSLGAGTGQLLSDEVTAANQQFLSSLFGDSLNVP